MNEAPGLRFTEAERQQGDVGAAQPAAEQHAGREEWRGQPRSHGPCPCGFGRRVWEDAFYFLRLQLVLLCHRRVMLQILGS